MSERAELFEQLRQEADAREREADHHRAASLEMDMLITKEPSIDRVEAWRRLQASPDGFYELATEGEARGFRNGLREALALVNERWVREEWPRAETQARRAQLRELAASLEGWLDKLPDGR